MRNAPLSHRLAGCGAVHCGAVHCGAGHCGAGHCGAGSFSIHVGIIIVVIVAGCLAARPALQAGPPASPGEHWAFRPVVRPEVPAGDGRGWARNPIDAFLAEGHRRRGLAPQDEATRLQLIRRLHVDLLGVLPSLEDLTAVAEDVAEDDAADDAAVEVDVEEEQEDKDKNEHEHEHAGWYERLVDRLLEDPRHGERWGRHWMDVWRYSDWWGLGDQLRNSHPHIWHWRDWIVESLNADVPYDQMVREMLAADELYPRDLAKLRATGFLARNYFLFNRNQWMDETVEHVAKGFLGLTVNCAKCHEHKYDPIEQADYYRLRAIFEPYHVRVDAVPGEADLGRDGIPRAFDGLLDAPTYLFERGDESRPDMSAPLSPGVPRFLAPGGLEVTPVDLPADAWQPERRAWVQEACLDAARPNIARMIGRKLYDADITEI